MIQTTSPIEYSSIRSSTIVYIHGATTLSIMTLSIMILSITVNKMQHSDNATQHNAEHCHDECTVMLSVIYKPYMLSFVVLNFVVLNVKEPIYAA
jgi:hypothetical protein